MIAVRGDQATQVTPQLPKRRSSPPPATPAGQPHLAKIANRGDTGDGRVRISYNGAEFVDEPLSGSGWYFKTGAYVQSNTEKGDEPDAVASVVLYGLELEHTD